jgi:hypothetical protein
MVLGWISAHGPVSRHARVACSSSCYSHDNDARRTSKSGLAQKPSMGLCSLRASATLRFEWYTVAHSWHPCSRPRATVMEDRPVGGLAPTTTASSAVVTTLSHSLCAYSSRYVRVRSTTPMNRDRLRLDAVDHVGDVSKSSRGVL